MWRYGDLELPAPDRQVAASRPNGTGKTTALEALWPYLYDLDAAKLVAGRLAQQRSNKGAAPRPLIRVRMADICAARRCRRA